MRNMSKPELRKTFEVFMILGAAILVWGGAFAPVVFAEDEVTTVPPSGKSKLKLPHGAPASEKPRPSHNVERVGGTYIVSAIDKVEAGFQVKFTAAAPSGSFDEIILESPHVHVGVKVGQQLRISAEVIGGDMKVAEATQVLVFLPTQRGEVPVWMLSSKRTAGDLRGARYLEMHAPETDYTIL
jgi:hypothetical protein